MELSKLVFLLLLIAVSFILDVIVVVILSLLIWF